MHFCLELTGELTGNLSTQKTNNKKIPTTANFKQQQKNPPHTISSALHSPQYLLFWGKGERNRTEKVMTVSLTYQKYLALFIPFQIAQIYYSYILL